MHYFRGGGGGAPIKIPSTSQHSPDDPSTRQHSPRVPTNDPGTNHHTLGAPITGLRSRESETSRNTGRSGRQNMATGRSTRREERVTVQGPVKNQQPDGMSHRGAPIKILGQIFLRAFGQSKVFCRAFGPSKTSAPLGGLGGGGGLDPPTHPSLSPPLPPKRSPDCLTPPPICGQNPPSHSHLPEIRVPTVNADHCFLKLKLHIPAGPPPPFTAPRCALLDRPHTLCGTPALWRSAVSHMRPC